MEALKKYFKIINGNKRYKVYCKKCDAAWSLNIDYSIGDELFLLNHAHSHEVKSKKS
jgi:hypothetical protein